YSGDGTYYYTELGSCGDYSDDWDYIAAVNTDQMENDDNPNDNPNCGRIINVEGPDGTVQVEAVDTCPTCDWGDIDLSPAAFSEIAGLNEGRVPISWEWA
ncbi:RlpA-like double-psi beta-barrel-protein domain-containing protein-containing protein, partial [Spinellus fusiger]